MPKPNRILYDGHRGHRSGDHGSGGPAVARDHFDAEAPVRGKGRTRFKIQHLFACGWSDFERSDPDMMDSDPITYESEASARKSLDEFISDANAAVAAGHLESGYRRHEFRVVPA
jgi:hypothetical protein